jgi:hypothetical protein
MATDWVWIDNRIYWTLTEHNYKHLRQSYWVAHTRDHCSYNTHNGFSVFTSRCLVVASNGWRSTSSGYPDYSTASATIFSLLTTATLNWLNSKSKLCYERQSIGQSVFVSSTHLGPKTRFLIMPESCGFVDMERPLWREDGCVVYNFCWPSPEQSFSDPSRAGPITIFYCLRTQSQSHIATDGQSISKSWCRAPSGAHAQIFITPPLLRSCFCGALSLTRGRVCLLYMLLALASIVFLGSESLGTRDHILLSQIWYFPFRRLLRLAWSRWRYSNPITGRRYIAPARTALKMSLPIIVFSRCWGNNVSSELSPSNGCCTVSCFHSCFLAMSLHVTTL